MRTIAATFESASEAETARARLRAQVHADRLVMAPAVVSESADGPIDCPRTILAVTVNGDAPIARELLVDSGGRLVADVEADEA